MGLCYGKVIGTILVNLYGITLGIDVGTELGFLDEYFDCYNDVRLEGLFLGDSLVYNDGKVFGYDEVINWYYLVVTLFSLYLKMYMESHLGLMLEHIWAL